MSCKPLSTSVSNAALTTTRRASSVISCYTAAAVSKSLRSLGSLGIDRTTASRQKGLSSKQAIQAAHHRMDGRPYGKLLPRYVGPIAEFLFAHPKAGRAGIIDFISHTWDIRVSRIALYHFLEKFGLDQPPSNDTATLSPLVAEPTTIPPPALPPPQAMPQLPAGRPVPTPGPPFSPHTPSTPAPSSSCHRR